MADELAGPLLYFDTGVGGLSILAESQALLPQAPIVYAADYAGLPYGKKSEQELAFRIPALLGRLAERYKPSLITIACNTASTIALDHARAALDIPIVGTVPAIKPASLLTRSGVIGLLGTEATIRQPYVDRLACDFASDKKLIRFGAPELVHAAEAKMRGEIPSNHVIQSAVRGLRDQPDGASIDVVILACTHFPLLRDELQRAFGSDVQLIDGAAGIARRIKFLTEAYQWPVEPTEGRFVTTGELAEIEAYRESLRNFRLLKLEKL